MGKGGSKAEINEYHMSIHYGVCTGPVDEVLEIFVDEKSAWAGSVSYEQEFEVHRPDLFGGRKKEGGVSGFVRFLLGGPSQYIPDHLAARMGEVAATCPGYRGILSLFFFRPAINTHKGYRWKSNVPYLPGAWVKVRRKSRGLWDAIALIGQDSNPAHMIYECVTNTDWGMGASPTIVDVASMEAAALTLYNEGFGLSLLWTRQSSIESFINEVIDHIQGAFYLNPRTGLLTLKLIRDDYDVNSLPLLTPDNCEVTKFQRKLWGETTNEIVVTWTNPVNEQEETVGQQDLANITQQGAIVSDSRNYYGVRNADLATKLAARDLRAAASPLASVELEVDRTAWSFLPGGLVRLTYPEHGITELILRIGNIDYGKSGQPTIKVTATEDVFTLQTQAYAAPPPSSWVDPSASPQPLSFVRPFTMPSFLSVVTARHEPGSEVYPEVLVAFLAAQDGRDTFNYELMDAETGAMLGTRNLMGHAPLEFALTAQATSVVERFTNVTGNIGPEVGRLVFIGDDIESKMEIARIEANDSEGWTLMRGVLDTVPRAWAAGTPIWFLDPFTNIYDVRAQAAFDTVDYKFLSRTSTGLLAAADAPVVHALLTDRPYCPLRPANVKIGSTAFGTKGSSGNGPWNVTWSNRNRLTEDAVILAWDDATVTPEVGQTTTITVMRTNGTVLTVIDDIEDTSFVLHAYHFDGWSSGRVRVSSMRDGFESIQSHEITMTGIS